MVLLNAIILGWYIQGVTKIKLMGNIIYDLTKGNTMKVDVVRRLMGRFCVTQNGGLGCFWKFIPNKIFFLRQPIPPHFRHYWRTWLLMIILWLNHINGGVYVKWTLIHIIGKLLKLIDTPPGFRSKLIAPLEFVVVSHWRWDK